MQHSIGQPEQTAEDPEITIRAARPEPQHGETTTTPEQRLWDHVPSSSQVMLLIGGMAVAAVAVVYAFSRNRQRFLEDTSNIDRRWDRPDRLADTRHEELRWTRDGLGADQREGLRSHAEGFAI